MILIAVMTLLRCATAACAPLIAGEAYYWLWGKHLAAGYFDHPPMVGVMSALFFGWIDGSELVARSGPIILGMITTLLLYLLGEELFPGQRAGWRAALAYSLIPICDLNSLFIGPDNSLALFTVLTWYLFWRAANRGDSWGLWIGAGAAAGLSLLSKFHAWVLLPPLYLFLMLSPAHRGRLRHGGPWLAIAVALIVLSPNLYWNAKHGWMNYVFQWHRSSIPRSHFDIKNPAIYFLGPLLGLSPLAYTAMVWGTYRGYGIWRHRRDAAVLFLLCAGLPLVLFLGALSFAVTISLHWPGVGQLALILLSIGLMGRNELFPPNYFRWMVYVAGAMTLLLHAAPFFLGRIPDHLPAPFGLKSIDSTRLKEESAGWPEIG
ncbi:glycosyltransferase family 39 protein, partial [Candidatus Sumerlaeota bacterium]|nr:glycosyltransferase family 39 protein [Candidatus Sumerlaeota bacterium]